MSIVIAISAFLFIFALSACRHPSTSPHTAQGIPALNNPPFQGFVISESFQRRDTLSLSATNSAGHLIRLDIEDGLDSTSATRLIDDGILGLDALYANALSPYPGDISNRIVTDKSYFPRRALKPDEPWFILYANDRLGFGPSTPEQIQYKALLGWIYCPKAGKLIKIRRFFPHHTPDQLLQAWAASIHCK